MLQAGLDERALFGGRDDLLDDGAELRERLLGRFVLGDPCPHADHLRERPVRHALSVGEAPPAMPPRLVDEPVDVLLELPREP